MKKNIRLIIICAVVVAVLAGLLVFLMGNKQNTPAEQQTTETTDEPTSSLLYSQKLDDLAVLTIENEHGSYKVERVEFEGQNVWTIKEIANLPLSNSIISALV